MTDINWGPTGELIYERTYARSLPDGSRETWPDTVVRVVDGNLALVPERFQEPDERGKLIRMMEEFKILPGGRHLWASGVKNAEHLFNCWVAGWTDKPSDHFEFTFLRLMEGGGVGANYSNHYLAHFPPVQQELYVHIVCDPEHLDHQAMMDAGVLSTEYDPDWMGAFVIEDSREGWASALVDLIDTHYRDEVTHYQRVYDVSRVRHAGAKLKTFGGRASGPLPLAQMLIDVCEILSTSYWNYQDGFDTGLTGIKAMEIDHAIAQCVVAGGVRRSARMSIMHWEDPQILAFLKCKEGSGSHWTTNISVEVDEGFWNALSIQGGSPKREWAQCILEGISEGMILNGEPGFWDSSLSNVGEPNPVAATNPCGEIALESWEPCNLGHVNLAAFVVDDGHAVDIQDLDEAHRLMTRFLIRATFSPVSDPKSQEVLLRNRRIGVGHFGVASYLAMAGIRYSEVDESHNRSFREMLRDLAMTVEVAAEEYCHQLRIPVPVKTRTVAPTGTIAKMPGVSEGIHPIFSRYFNRRIRFNGESDQRVLENLIFDGHLTEPDLYAANTTVVTIPTKDILVDQVTSLGYPEDIVESADQLTLNEMLAFQATYQTCWADNAVSFTANVDPGQYLATDVARELQRFAGLIKGATIFPDKSRPQAPYERITKEQYEQSISRAVGDGVDEECSSGACPIR